MRRIFFLAALYLLCQPPAFAQGGRTLQVERLTSGPSIDFTDFPDFAAIHISSGIPGLRITSEISEVMRIAISDTETLLIVTPTNQRVVFQADGYSLEVLDIAAMRPRQTVWVRVSAITIGNSNDNQAKREPAISRTQSSQSDIKTDKSMFLNKSLVTSLGGNIIFPTQVYGSDYVGYGAIFDMGYNFKDNIGIYFKISGGNFSSYIYNNSFVSNHKHQAIGVGLRANRHLKKNYLYADVHFSYLIIDDNPSGDQFQANIEKYGLGISIGMVSLIGKEHSTRGKNVGLKLEVNYSDYGFVSSLVSNSKAESNYQITLENIIISASIIYHIKLLNIK